LKNNKVWIIYEIDDEKNNRWLQLEITATFSKYDPGIRYPNELAYPPEGGTPEDHQVVLLQVKIFDDDGNVLKVKTDLSEEEIQNIEENILAEMTRGSYDSINERLTEGYVSLLDRD
jgi:hypothetical protein